MQVFDEGDSETTANTDQSMPESSIGDAARKKRKTVVKPTSVDDCKKVAMDAMNKALKKMDENDSFQVFGDFIASELRKIPDKTNADRIQRKMQRVLLDCMDELDECNITRNVIMWLKNCGRS